MCKILWRSVGSEKNRCGLDVSISITVLVFRTLFKNKEVTILKKKVILGWFQEPMCRVESHYSH